MDHIKSKVKTQNSKLKTLNTKSIICNKFIKYLKDLFVFSKNQVGFTLLEVLVSIGLLGTMIFIVAYITVSNQNEILRHNAETYADLIASQQFSYLVAYRNKIAFDNNDQTNWANSILPLANNNMPIYFKEINNKIEITNQAKTESKPLDESHNLSFDYNLKLEKMSIDGIENKNLVRAHITITYNDRNGAKEKDYYTVLTNHLGLN